MIGSARRVHLARFLVLGLVLLAGRRLLVPASDGAAPLVVEVAAGTDDGAIRRAVVDAVLVDEAVRARWPLADPVVRERLRDAAAVAGLDADAEPGQRLASSLPALDPVTRARLVWIGRELMRAELPSRAPTAAELAAYRDAHPARYEPAWLGFRQRVVSHARRGAHVEAAARALADELAAAGPDATGGDPSLLPARMSGTPAMIDARFGPGFAARVAAAPEGRWSGPVPGTFGAHVVWRERAHPPDEVAARDAVALRVARDWAHDRHADELRRAIDRLVARRRVVVREVTP